MPTISEPTMQETLWSWFSDQGYTVDGEVSLGSAGRIDLVAHKIGENRYVGIELKDQANRSQSDEIPSAIPGADVQGLSNTSVSFNEATDHWKQVRRYQTSGYLDKVYFASQRPSSVIDSINRESVALVDDSPSVEEIYAETDATPNEVGAIKLTGPHDETTIEIVREATSLSREHTPSLSKTDEQWIQHHIWDEVGGVREGVLPNHQSAHFRRIDIASFSGSDDTTDVYDNQETNDIIGIEAKGAKAFTSGTGRIGTQLRRYIDCGALTRVYLGVPEKNRDEALSLLEDNKLKVAGLYTVDTNGTVTHIRDAAKLPLKYDGIKTKEGYTVDIIFGYGDSEDWSYGQDQTYRSVFDMMSDA